MQRKLITLFLSSLSVLMSSCDSGRTEEIKVQNIAMPKECREYFDGLKDLAKDNKNLANKFGERLADIDNSWKRLNNVDRQRFTSECVIRNKQLKEMKGTPELEKLMNEL